MDFSSTVTKINEDTLQDLDEIFQQESITMGRSMSFDTSNLLCFARQDNGTHSSPCSPNREYKENRTRSYSDSEDRPVLNLEDLERDTHLNGDKDDYHMLELEIDKNNVLVIPHELGDLTKIGSRSLLTPSPGLSAGELDSMLPIVTSESLTLETPDGTVSPSTFIRKNAATPQVRSDDFANLVNKYVQLNKDESDKLTHIVVHAEDGEHLYKVNTRATVAERIVDDVSGISVAQIRPSKVLNVQEGYFVMPISSESNDVTNSVNLLNNIKNLKNNGSKPVKLYVCGKPGCGQCFKKAVDFKHHVATSHTAARPFKCQEPGCHWSFDTAFKMKRHKLCHSGVKEFVCDVEGCNRRFTTTYNLNAHRRLHSMPCNVACPHQECNEKFRTESELHEHLKKMHRDMQELYSCSAVGCDRKFLSKKMLVSHRRKHQRPQNLTCPFNDCSRSFDQQCRLRQHIRSHTGERPFRCSFKDCDWSFATASKLKRHEFKHSEKRPFVCPFEECGKTFLRAEHLRGHEAVHSGIRPFTCPVENCNARFNARSSVYSHLKKHTELSNALRDVLVMRDAQGRTRFHCPFETCDSSYSTKFEVHCHVASHYPSSAASTAPPTEELEVDDMRSMTSADSTVCEMASLDTRKLYDTAEGQRHSSALEEQLLEPVIGPASSARTDSTSNQILANKARKRREAIRKSAANLANEMSNQSHLIETTESLATAEQRRGLTVRDPATGNVYLQTQLLQDDPETENVVFSGAAIQDLVQGDLQLSLLPEASQSLVQEELEAAAALGQAELDLSQKDISEFHWTGAT